MGIIAIFSILILITILFITEALPMDQVSILCLILLGITGLVPMKDLLSGFSNPAFITVAAMFVLAAGITKTGLLTVVAQWILATLGERRQLVIFSILITVGIASAFLNNTAIVTIFIPLMFQISKIYKIPASKLLMPLSIMAVLGGTCTVIGTSTNVLASSLTAGAGLGAFGFFEMAPFGLLVTIAGVLYCWILGIRLIPPRATKGILEEFALRDYITELLVTVDSSAVNRTVEEWEPQRVYGLEVLAVRDDKKIYLPSDKKVIRAGDYLWVRGSAEAILKVQQIDHLIIPAGGLGDLQEKILLQSDDIKFVEAVIGLNSKLVGMTVHEANTRELNNILILAIRRRGRVLRRSLGDTILEPGDCVLIQGRKNALHRLRSDIRFLIMEPVEPGFIRKEKIPIALLILGAVVTTAAFNIYPIAFCAMAGAFLMVLTGCLRLNEVYESIDWKILILIAGLIPLGLALEGTGAANLAIQKLFSLTGSWSPVLILSVLYLFTTFLTEVLSNTACVVIMLPFAFTIGHKLNLDPRPFIMAVTFASSLSFMTPIGYQTNTMIFGIGGYKFTDFFRVGAPLNLICWLLATFLIPIFWPF